MSHWPDPALVAVFALARLGRESEARRELDEWLATRARDSDRTRTATENLAVALTKAAAQPR
jgi:hypothetical protein